MLDIKVNNEVTVSDLLSIFRFRWIRILIVGVLVGALVFGYNSLFVVPQYRATAQMFVDTRKESSEGKDTYIQSSHILAAKELTSTYVHIIKTNTILNKVIDELGLEMSDGALRSKIDVEVLQDTQILKINVTDEDPQRALDIVSKIVEFTPTIINAKIDSGKLISIDDPSVTSGPVSPNITLNTFIGFFVGALAVYAFYLVKRLLDNKFKSSEDIQRILNLPVLGVIPELSHLTSK